MTFGLLPETRSRDDGRTSILQDLRSGAAPWPLRMALTIVAAGIMIAAVLFVLGLVEMSARRISDEHVAVCLILAGAAWGGATTWIWSGQRRARRVILSAIGVLGVWMVTIPLCVLIDEVFAREEMLIGGCIVAAVAASILIIAISTYRGIEGRAVQDDAGRVNVNCPRCGYSMVGLETCLCPECGGKYTLDQLIRAQEYGAVRRSVAWRQPVALDPTTDDGPDDLTIRPPRLAAPDEDVAHGS